MNKHYAEGVLKWKKISGFTVPWQVRDNVSTVQITKANII